MPYFNPSPYAPVPVLMESGKLEYLLGRRVPNQADTSISLQSVTDDGTNATFTGQIIEGNIPIVGSLFSSLTSDPANYNAVNAKISAIAFNVNGQGTVTIPSMHAGSEALSGNGLIPVPEVPETLVNGVSIPITFPMEGGSSISRTMLASVTFPQIPSAATVTLQGAMRNFETEYVDLKQIGIVAGGAVTQTQAQFAGEGMYYRYHVTGVSGAGTVIGRLLV